MEPISPNAQGIPAAVAGSPGSRSTVIDSDFETFLRMLTTQMRNQDPLNPMEATDFAIQLATFSGVEQQVRTNQLLEGLVAQSGIVELAGLVGMTARAAVPAYYDGSQIRVAIEPSPGADRAELVVRNAMGNIVDTLELVPGERTVSWSGLGADGTPMATGRYSFEIASYAGGEMIGSGPAEIYAPVMEARRVGTGTVVVFPGGVEVPAESVTALRRPEPRP